MHCLTKSCKEIFGTFEELKSHCIANHHAYFHYKCGSCSMTYNLLIDLELHMGSHDRPIRPIQAGDHSANAQVSNVANDDPAGTTKALWKCPECSIEFPTVEGLIKHHPIHYYRYKCIECPCCFMDSKGLRKHEEAQGHNLKVLGQDSTNATAHRDNCTSDSEAIASDLVGLTIATEPNNTTIAGSEPQRRLIFKCDVCSAILPNLQRQQEHQAGHTTPVKCSKCPAEFLTAKRLRRHERKVCPILSNRPAIEHTTTKAKSKPKKIRDCTQCDKKFKSLSSLTTHTLNAHGGPEAGSWKCSVCQDVFVTEKLFRDHDLSFHRSPQSTVAESHDNAEAEASDSWESLSSGVTSYGTVGSLTPPSERISHSEHVQTPASGVEEWELVPSQNAPPDSSQPVDCQPNLFNCARCGEDFGSNIELEKHSNATVVAHFSCVVCLACARPFLTQELLEKHQRKKKHAGSLSDHTQFEKCPQMKSIVPLKQQLDIFKCEICEKEFKREKALEAHINSIPNSHCFFKCSTCKRSFFTENIFDMHREKMHPGSIEVIARKPSFPCSICGKEFENKRALKLHVISEAVFHSTWKCSLCYRIFITRSKLERHQAKKHHINPDGTPNNLSNGASRRVGKAVAASQERPFACLICPASFGKPSAVAHHLESGCHPNFTRHHITSAVKALDVVPQITVKQITGPIEPPAPITVHQATSNTWNGSEFKCFLCPKGFLSLAGLNSHLNSAAHDDKEFKCPKCQREYTLISALVQHLESLTCGLAQAGEIINFYDGLSARFSNKLLIA